MFDSVKARDVCFTGCFGVRVERRFCPTLNELPAIIMNEKYYATAKACIAVVVTLSFACVGFFDAILE